MEADPAGGQLADMVGADPYLGLASLARTITADELVEPDRIVEHVQFLPGGVALLAAPPRRDVACTVSAASLLTDGSANLFAALGATVFADCGAPEPDSALAPVLANADACLVALRADRTDPELAARRIHALTRHSQRRGIVLIGASLRSGFAAALALPLLGTLPDARASAEALLHGTAGPRRSPHLLPAARTVATALHHQLRPPAPVTRPPTHRSIEQPRRTRQPADAPTIYRLELPGSVTGHSPEDPDPFPASSAPGLAPGELAEAAGPPATGGVSEESEPLLVGQSADRPLADAAPQTAAPGLAVRIFGSTRVVWRAPETGESVEITGRLQPRSREVLAVLALHPDGVSRPRLIDMLWGERPPVRATAALTNTLSRLRTAVASATEGQITGLLTDDRLHCRLSAAVITIDYWQFNAAVAARRRASGEADQIAASRLIADLATADLAADLTGAWVEPLRESARRDALNAMSWLATRNAENDPRATLGMLEETAESDPYNETIWQDILRLHARLGEYSALARTYSLLTRKLAEIGQTPSQETRQLLHRLRSTAR
ncbi:BTAD domain-containing putative transcriptional regulator [Nocardia vulneris]|uniref:BTAD domain-containing putative transcriptional regulator n=1 Tax=Nocardia vulneris TaxID=1141657 RepID=UPI0030D3E024